MSGRGAGPAGGASRARRGVRVVVGAAVAVAAALSLVALSRAPWTATSGTSELRLAWRARVPRVEECRRLTPEEQAQLPVHMRREEVCEGRVASYLLRVVVDGRTVRSDTVAGAGARGDRPLYVSESIHLRPGAHDVEVSFTRLGAEGAEATEAEAAEEAEEAEEAAAEAAEAAPAARAAGVPDRLVLRRRIDLEPREVALVSYHPDRRRLELRGAEPTR